MKVIAAFLVNTLCNFAIGLLVARFLGPAEFGRFALALAVAAVLQTAQFEWIRLAAIRFYSQRSRDEQPDLRSTLDFCFGLVAAAVTIIASLAMISGHDLWMPNTLIGLAVAASIVNGVFDYNTAMVRARFDDTLYSRLVLTKNLVALVCTAGGALLFHSATMALLGVCMSMTGSLLIFRKGMMDAGARSSLAKPELARLFFRYSAPIVVANLLYLVIPLVNRALAAHVYGYAEAGQFSLAFDIGARVVASIGSALDVLLFQLAVRAAEQHGAERGREQVATNMGIVLAIMAPTCAGIWLTLPSIEHIVVPLDFRGPFEHYFSLLLPGHFAFGLLCFAVNPVFQIAKRTRPMIFGAIAAAIADMLCILFLPAQPASLAIAQSCAMITGIVVLIGWAATSGARFPRARDVAATIAGSLAMIAVLLPLRAMPPGILVLLTQVCAGVFIYVAFIAVFDIAGLRGVGFGVAKTLRMKLA